MAKKNTTSQAGVRMSPGRVIWRRLKRNKSAYYSLIFLILLIAVAILVPVFVDEELVTKQDLTILHQPPSKEHIFGTDIFGRDIFIRILFGARMSLMIGIVSCVVGTVIGGIIGACAAYFGGVVDQIIMRISDMLQGIPEMLMSICIVTVFGANIPSLMIAMIVAIIAPRCRLVRSTILGVSGREFIEAAKIAGMSDFKIVLTQMIPNSIGPVIVVFTQGVASIMLTAAGLSYLGVGIQPPHPEWGALIAAAREYLRIYPYMCVFPGLVITVTALAFNLLGDGLRDAIDPRLKD